MPKTFNVTELTAESTVEVTLKNGVVLHSRELTNDVIDSVGQVEDKHARQIAALGRKGAEDERIATGQKKASDEEVEQANLRLIDLATERSRLRRALPFEQLAKLLVDPDGKPLPVKALQDQMPLVVAEKLTVAILLDEDGGQGNPAGSEQDATPSGTTA